jgi:hypothetical protein
MNISFPEGPLDYDAEQLALTFPAIADSVSIECAITAEALEDHFGARTRSCRGLPCESKRHRESGRPPH